MRSPRPSKYSTFSALAILGLSCGWLLGLSFSPVLHIVLGGALGLGVSAVATLMGMHHFRGNPSIASGEEGQPSEALLRDRHINPWPLAIIAGAVVVSSSAGIFVRTNQLLGPNPTLILARWRQLQALTPEARDFVLSQMTVQSPGAHEAKARNGKERNKEKETPELALAREGGLFAFTATQCSFIRGQHGKELRVRLDSLQNEVVSRAVARSANDEQLEGIAYLLCELSHK